MTPFEGTSTCIETARPLQLLEVLSSACALAFLSSRSLTSLQTSGGPLTSSRITPDSLLPFVHHPPLSSRTLKSGPRFSGTSKLPPFRGAGGFVRPPPFSLEGPDHHCPTIREEVPPVHHVLGEARRGFRWKDYHASSMPVPCRMFFGYFITMYQDTRARGVY